MGETGDMERNERIWEKLGAFYQNMSLLSSTPLELKDDSELGS